MTINEVPYYIIRSLVLTIIIEVVVGIIIGIKNKKDILNIVLVNMITNPIVNIVPIMLNIYVSLKARNISIYVLEVLILFTEGLIYKKVLNYKKLNYFLISFILNLSSYGIGVLHKKERRKKNEKVICNYSRGFIFNTINCKGWYGTSRN